MKVFKFPRKRSAEYAGKLKAVDPVRGAGLAMRL